MARLTDQIKELKEQLASARVTIELQADKITELTQERQKRIEDTAAYQNQMNLLRTKQEALEDKQRDYKREKALQDKIDRLEAEAIEKAGQHSLELFHKDEEIKNLKALIDWQEAMINALRDERPKPVTNTERIPNGDGHKPGARRKYDAETRQRIRELYSQGNSMSQIARETGASKTQIHAIVHEGR